jgi:hypothetical protein
MSNKKKRNKRRYHGPERYGNQCIGCFCTQYLHERGGEALDFQSEVDGLTNALDANGYTGLATASRERLEEFLDEHFRAYADDDELGQRRAAIARAAIVRGWESYHRPVPA